MCDRQDGCYWSRWRNVDAAWSCPPPPHGMWDAKLITADGAAHHPLAVAEDEQGQPPTIITRVIAPFPMIPMPGDKVGDVLDFEPRTYRLSKISWPTRSATYEEDRTPVRKTTVCNTVQFKWCNYCTTTHTSHRPRVVNAKPDRA